MEGFNNVKILLVDDTSVLRKILKILLVSEFGASGDNVYEAGNGDEAVQIYKEKAPDIVLLDIAMPGKNGIDTLKEIIEIDPNAYVVMCTSSSEEEAEVASKTAGAKSYLAKPPNTERLQQIFTDLLQNKAK